MSIRVGRAYVPILVPPTAALNALEYDDLSHAWHSTCTGCPRQGAKAPTTRARLVLREDLNHHVLDGLDTFSHVWLVFVFHANDETPLMRTKMRPPRLQGDKIGMFASRTPHRVNPIVSHCFTLFFFFFFFC